jgi:flagellar hook-length control protein FliK
MTTMIATPTPVANVGTGTSSSIFAQAQQSAMPGLFGLLMALFSGENGGIMGDVSQTDLLNGVGGSSGESSGLMTGQEGQMSGLLSLFSPQTAAQVQEWLSGQNLPSDQINFADLAQLPGLSQQMQDMLKASGSLEELQANFAQLNNEDQESVLGEMAELLAAAQMIIAPGAPQKSAPLQQSNEGIDAASAAETVADAAINRKPTAQADLAGLQAQQQETDNQESATIAAAGAQNAASKAQADEALMQAALTKARHLLGVDQDATDRQAGIDDLSAEELLVQANTIKDKLVRSLQSAQTTQTQLTDKAAAAAASVPAATQTDAATQQVVASTASSVQAVQNSSGNDSVKVDNLLSGMKSDTAPTAPQPQTAAAANNQAAAAALADGGFDKLLKEAAGAGSLKTDAHQQLRFDRFGAQTPITQQVGIHLGKAMADGQSRITIKLVPAELGRIDVRLDMSGDGRVTASFQVENASTLSLLQKDSAGIERALTDAGLKTDQQSLNFNLKGDGQRQSGAQQQQAGDSGRQGGQSQQQAQGLQDMSGYDGQAGELELTWYVGPSGVNVRV